MKTISTALFLALACGGFAHAAPGTDPAGDPPQEQAAAQHAFAEYAGTYPLAPGFDLVIRERDGALSVQATGQGEFPLDHVEGDGFANPALGLEIDFQRDADGSVDLLELRQAGQVLRGERG